MIRNVILIAAVILPNTAVRGQSASNEEAVRDAARLNEAYQKYRTPEYRELFQVSSFGVEFADKVAGYRERLKQLEAFEQSDKPQIGKLLAEVSSRYGSDVAAIRRTFREINNAGGSVAGDPAYWWEELGKVSDAPGETRQKIADELNRLGSSTGGQTAQGYERMTVEESYERAKVYLELALAYQPDHAEAQSNLKVIDTEKSEHMEADKEAVDAAEFGDNAVSFQGDADAMQTTAFEYLSTRASGQDGKLLAVRIAGDWHPQDTTLGVTITWGLPVEAAYVIEDDPETAKVVSMNLVTQEEHPEPPFQRFVITGERLMRVDNLPGAASDQGFGVMRLPLSLSLLVIGLIGAGPVLQKYVPALKGVLDQLAPYAAVVGVIALAVGIVGLSTSLLSPFQDLLPQAGAIVLGLLTGLDVLVRRRVPDEVPSEAPASDSEGDMTEKAQETLRQAKDAADKAVTKAQDLLVRNESQIRKLNTYRVPLALGCLVLGLLHLLIGGTWLF